MKNNLVFLLFLLLSFISCKEKNLRQDFQLNNLDEEEVLKSDEGIVLTCRLACGKDHACLIDCIKAVKSVEQAESRVE